MKLSKILLQTNIRQQLNGSYIAPIALAGAVGIGKSTLVNSVAKNANMGVFTVNIATTSLVTVSGLPMESEVEGHGKVVTWSQPELIFQSNSIARENNGGCILFLDDLHTAEGDVQNLFLELLLERTINGHKLDGNVAIVSALNLSEEAGAEGMNSSVRNRLQMIEVEFDFDTWWDEYGAKLNPVIGSFIKANQSVLFEDESSDYEGFGTSRSVSFLANTVDALEPDFFEANAKRIAEQYVSKAMSSEVASHAQVFYKMQLEEKVKNREDLMLGEKSTLDSILFAYCASYVKTEDDMKWMIGELIKDDTPSAFTGLATSLIYANYNSDDMSEATIFFVQELLKEKSTVFGKKQKMLFSIMSKYLL